MLKVNNNNSRKRCKIRSKVSLKTSERCQWCRSGTFEHISHFFLLILLLTWNYQLEYHDVVYCLDSIRILPTFWLHVNSTLGKLCIILKQLSVYYEHVRITDHWVRALKEINKTAEEYCGFTDIELDMRHRNRKISPIFWREDKISVLQVHFYSKQLKYKSIEYISSNLYFTFIWDIIF